MYIDSLTITALVIFFGALYLFVRFCVIKICGMTQVEEEVSSREDPRNGVS